MNRKTRISKYYDLFTLDCVLRIYWFQGYFIKIGSSEIANIASVTELFLFGYALYLIIIKEIQIEKNYFKILTFFLVINFFGIFLEVIFPYDGVLLPDQEHESWDDLVLGRCYMYNYYPSFGDFAKTYFMLTMFGFNVVIFKQVYDRDRFVCLYMKIIKLIKYGVFYGAFEFIAKNIIGNLNITYDISAILLGVNELAVYKEAFVKNGLYTLQGLTREPSHFNCFLFSYIFFVTLGRVMLKHNKEYMYLKPYNNFTVFIAVLLLLLSGGFSAVWYLFVLFASSFIIRVNESKFNISILHAKTMLSISFSFFIIMIIVYAIMQNDYFYKRLCDAFLVIDYIIDVDNAAVMVAALGGGEGLGSTIARMFSTYVGINIFLNRPLFGLGYCLQPVHSFTALFLANMGVMGVYSIYKILSFSMSRKFDSMLMFLFFVIGGLPITIVPLGLSVHWLLFFEATHFYKK